MNIITKPFFNESAPFIKGPPNQRMFGRYRGQIYDRRRGDQNKYNNNHQPIKVLNNKKNHEQNNYADKQNTHQHSVVYSPKIVSPPIESEKIEQIEEKHASKQIEIQNELPIIQVQQKEELQTIIAIPNLESNEQIEKSKQIQLQQQPELSNTQSQLPIQTFPLPLLQQPQQLSQQLLMPQQIPPPLYNLAPNANPYSPVPFPYGYQHPPYPPINQPYIQSSCIFPNRSVISTSFVLNAEEIQKYTQFLMEQLRIYEYSNNISLSKSQ